jgi:M3 family oligoendopeptidase
VDAPRFAELSAPTPAIPSVEAEYAEIAAALDAHPDGDALLALLRRWDRLRVRLASWVSLARVHFTQDTRDADAKRERERADELEPRFQALDVGIKRRLLSEPLRGTAEKLVAPQALALWQCSVSCIDPAIEEPMVREGKLAAEYTELLASAKLRVRGQTCNHETILPFLQDPDRALRREAAEARCRWFDENADRLDAIYDGLVRLRDGMARELGYPSFVPMAYRRMYRVDYGPEDVARYRDAVREHVVPLAAELCEEQRSRLGVERLVFWDELLADPRGNPRPQGDRDWMLERARQLFRALGGGLAPFFDAMVERDLLDLDAREGKATGGYCEFFGTFGVPFVFATFSGTERDARIFTHEMGHAFQAWSSRDKFPWDLVCPSMDGCEIHSMSLEALSAAHAELFFGEDAERFRRLHLRGSLLFLPYGVAVDHFQHLVYEQPDVPPAVRHEWWREMERLYLPWRDYDDLPYLPRGGLWQGQLHIYTFPFYYIDYTLAVVCALQYGQWAERDRDAAMASYFSLCRRGGEAPFQTLVRDAGLASPLDPGCLEEVVARARAQLG